MIAKVVIVGAGRSGRELAQRLKVRHEVTVVESERKVVARFNGDAPPIEEEELLDGIRVVAGDGTSRLVLSKLLDSHGSTALIAMSGTDEVNLEVGRAGREVGFDPVVAILHDPAMGQTYHDHKIAALNRAQLVANHIERSLEFKGEAVPCGVGLGQGEIVELRLASTSPILDRPLRELAPDRWRIAAVFRDDELIVPTGETTLGEGDRILLVGQPEMLVSVAQYLRTGTPQFPGQFGPNVVTIELAGRDEALAEEARALARGCDVARVTRGIAGARPTEATDDQEQEVTTTFAPPTTIDRRLFDTLTAQRPGVVLTRCEPRSLMSRVMGRRSSLAALCDALDAPVLVSRESWPYKRILIPVSASEIAINAAELSIDLARKLDSSLTAINVDLPRYISGEPEELAHFEVVPIRRLCELYDVQLAYRHSEGNPIRRVLREASKHDLIVVARRRGRRDTFWNPDVAIRLALGAPCSALVLTVGT